MDIAKICGIMIAASVAALILRRFGTSFEAALTVAVTVSVAAIFVPKISDVVNTVITIASDGGASEVFPIVLKVTAVALICDMTSDICKGCGSLSLAKTVSVAGRFEILFISLPLFASLYKNAVSFLSAG